MRIIFLGDSITAGAGAGTVENMYTAQIEKLTGAEVLNYGVGGTRIARQTRPSADPSFDKDFLQRAQTMEKEADLVFVFGGTNDYGHGDAPIGAITDETPYTFCGALNSLIDYLSGVYGVEKLRFILPVHRKNEDDPHGEFGCKKIAAGSLSDYINAEISVLDNRGVGYLDLRDVIPADKLDELTADGVHPDATGHKLLADAIVSRCGLIALNEYYKWLAATINDEKTHDELLKIKSDKDEINDRFYCELKFGTGGLRGKLGAGTNRMNIYTVGRATRGLAAYINKTATENKSAVIAYDSRNMSREFAFLAADILSGAGIKTYVFNTLTPTPVLSFAVRYLKTSAGIVITASHNPKEYNGYKVYNEKGCQITDGAAKEILSEIEKCGYFGGIRADRSIIEVLDETVLNEFLRKIQKYSLLDLDGVKTPKIVYTPLNGTGNIPVRSILKIIGVKDVTVVPEQENPDGNFPTCPYPNPEEKAALKLAAELAEKENADLVLATDPDADRIGIAVKTNDGLKLLNGNETGVLMEDFIFSLRKKTNKIPVVVKTIVTSDMSEDIAKSYGAQVKEVLTGFKYIGETIDKLSENEEYVFGMEESYGYLVGTHARDKDAVSAAMIMAEMTAYYGLQGKTLADKLDELYKKYGYYKTALKSVSFPGEKGKAQMDEIISSLRNEPWEELCGEKVAVKDYSLGINGLPKSNVLSFTGENIKVTVRPSGTEPKLKLYYQVKAKGENDAEKLLQEVKISVEENLINNMYEYIENFKRLGFGMFIHFGLYSVIGRGEWYYMQYVPDKNEYESTINKFKITKNWAKNLVKTAKDAGCKYITLTTRHHDGFSLYDTCGLSEFDAPHSLTGRDLIREFVDECNKEGIIPFFYHTLLDWHNPDYNNDFPKYIDYLDKSIEILCKNYGKIGGFWFDGMWDKPNEDWQEDRIYGTIRKYQPEAMIINNTGLNALGQTGHIEIDSVTFERGKPAFVDTSEKPIAGEVCDALTDHWGYAKYDICLKSPKELIETLIDCRKYDCNLLLNSGLKGNGEMDEGEKAAFKRIGMWIKENKNFIYNAKSTDLTAENADMMTDGEYYYAAIKGVLMSANCNVAKFGESKTVTLNTDKRIVDAEWLDSGREINLKTDKSFVCEPFEYGKSLAVRVAKFKLK